MLLGLAPATDYLRAAEGLQAEGNEAAALRVLGRGAARHPGHYDLQFHFAVQLHASGDTEAALAAFLDAAVADPSAIAPHARMARVFAEEGDWEAVTEACRAALSLNPRDEEMQRRLDEAQARAAPDAQGAGAGYDDRMDISRLGAFSQTYSEARGKFLAAAKARHLSVRSYMNPAEGPSGEGLWADAIVLGSDAATKVLIANSATHGAEGFCGSAALVDWLQAEQPEPPDGVRLVLIHAINPFGFAWLRRVTEDNIDLNRNFLADFDDPPANADYGALHEHLLVGGGAQPDWPAAKAALDAYAAEHGEFAMQGALSRGQYAHADGLFYGGAGPGWSNRTFRAILDEMVSGAEHVAFIDFHTGLGPFGHAELISKCDPDDPEFQRLLAWFGPSVKTSAAGESTSPMLSGLIAGAVRALAPPGTVSAITAEFGTYPLWDVLRALQQDNWLHASGHVDTPEGERIKRNLKEIFYPDHDDWRELVLVRARQLIRNGLAGLDAL